MSKVITLDYEYEHDYILIGINSTLEDYRLAYLLNKDLRINLEREPKDLDFSTRTIRQWIYDKKIPEKQTIKINGSWRISAEWLYEYVEKLKNEKIEEILEK